MRKSVITFIAATVGLSGCSTTNHPVNKEPMMGMANPASEFCIKHGGKPEPKKDKDGGEYALCHLPDGQVIEEWEYFRRYSK